MGDGEERYSDRARRHQPANQSSQQSYQRNPDKDQRSEGWLSALTAAMKEVIEETKSPSLADLMVQYMELESRRLQKYSGSLRLNRSVSVFEDVKKSIDDLNADAIYTLDDLEKAITKVKSKSYSTQQIASAARSAR